MIDAPQLVVSPTVATGRLSQVELDATVTIVFGPCAGQICLSPRRATGFNSCSTSVFCRAISLSTVTKGFLVIETY